MERVNRTDEMIGVAFDVYKALKAKYTPTELNEILIIVGELNDKRTPKGRHTAAQMLLREFENKILEIYKEE